MDSEIRLMEAGQEDSGRYVYLCEGTPEGILTAVYDAYADRHGHRRNRIQIVEGCYSQELWCTYISVETDFEKASKVARTLQEKVSDEVYEAVQKAALTEDPRRAEVIYRVIILALKRGRYVLDALTEPNVCCLMEYMRGVNNEIHRMLEFLRFEELKNGFLFARINPRYAVLPYLAEHFADRFAGENWIIADTVHGGVLIHERYGRCVLARADEVDFDAYSPEYSEDEELWQRLWKRFVDAIAIKERKSPHLQMQMLPLRCRKYMKEFSTRP